MQGLSLVANVGRVGIPMGRVGNMGRLALGASLLWGELTRNKTSKIQYQHQKIQDEHKHCRMQPFNAAFVLAGLDC